MRRLQCKKYLHWMYSKFQLNSYIINWMCQRFIFWWGVKYLINVDSITITNLGFKELPFDKSNMLPSKPLVDVASWQAVIRLLKKVRNIFIWETAISNRTYNKTGVKRKYWTTIKKSLKLVNEAKSMFGYKTKSPFDSFR